MANTPLSTMAAALKGRPLSATAAGPKGAIKGGQHYTRCICRYCLFLATTERITVALMCASAVLSLVYLSIGVYRCTI
jgi:hypothetical protein